MGKKITIDSATLMNKGLEVIEAHYLFAIDYDHIQVVVHPQSVIHSMVQFIDGSLLAQLGIPDMRIPIQYALSYPDRWDLPLKRLNFDELGTLNFRKPDYGKFPCLRMAFDAGRAGGSLPAVLNAANEIAVEHFLCKKIGFNDIPAMIDRALQAHTPVIHPSIEQILSIDKEIRIKFINKEFA
jgi:1-deoxy-D-xylulose-5-phosphate reductoisomerase